MIRAAPASLTPFSRRISVAKTRLRSTRARKLCANPVKAEKTGAEMRRLGQVVLVSGRMLAVLLAQDHALGISREVDADSRSRAIPRVAHDVVIKPLVNTKRILTGKQQRPRSPMMSNASAIGHGRTHRGSSLSRRTALTPRHGTADGLTLVPTTNHFVPWRQHRYDANLGDLR